MKVKYAAINLLLVTNLFVNLPVLPQIGKRFPSERKVIKDPVTGTELIFLTSTPAGDHKIYPTHNQWTSDGEWLIFSSRRVNGEAISSFDLAIRMIREGKVNLKGLVTHKFPLNQYKQAFKMFRKKTEPLVKVVFDMGDRS